MCVFAWRSGAAEQAELGAGDGRGAPVRSQLPGRRPAMPLLLPPDEHRGARREPPDDHEPR